MTTPIKRKDSSISNTTPKRQKRECSYGEGCYRKNPAHFREFSHPHLESILDSHKEGEEFQIPQKLNLQKHMIVEQLQIIIEKQLYEPISKNSESNKDIKPQISDNKNENISNTNNIECKDNVNKEEHTKKEDVQNNINDLKCTENKDSKAESISSTLKNNKMEASSSKQDTEYRPIVPPTRRIEDFLKVVAPRGKMADKHAASAPYHIFYTTIQDSRATHTQPYSITFQEILDPSLGELKCSLQINFMVEIGWLLAQYYFAGYSNKRLTILYGDDCDDMRTINKKKPLVDAHYVSMPTPFGKHHTKMMILCYEDGSLRVVVSTANLYIDDWENRTQGLWFSPKCPEMSADAMPHEGESPTLFKRYLIKYLNHYRLPQLSYYVEKVKRCDFSHINVFLVSSAPGSHFDTDWGMLRAGTLLRQHCEARSDWPVIAQASSIGSYGAKPQLWLTGDFLHNFAKIKAQPQMLMKPPELKIIYPSLENVRQSHDGLLGGGCLPYAADLHTKQMWLKEYLYQWKAAHTGRDKAMPHIKSYTRVSRDNKMAAFYLLTSANISKAAWGQLNKGNGALRLMSYEAGVLFLPKFVINKDLFPLQGNDKERLIVPYDLPPVAYAEDMSPWVQDYLR